MRLDTGQHMRLDQRMKLSPRMIQSMEILQLPALALDERIEQEMETNPLLEQEEPTPDAETAAELQRAADPTSDGEGEQPLVVGENAADDSEADFKRLDDISEQYGETWDQNNYSSAGTYSPSRMAGERDMKMDAMANTAARAPSLPEQLLDQWRFVEMDEAIRRAGAHLISFIDDDGYLRVEMEQVLNQAPPGVTEPQLREALELVEHKLEPTGIGAADLRQCLLLQLDALADENGEDDEMAVARQLVSDHLKDIEMNRLPRIARKLGLSIDDVTAALGRLRRLDPHPGRQLVADEPQTIIPDLIVEFDPMRDAYVVALMDGRRPPLRINPHYRSMARQRELDKPTRQFLSERLHSARWLIDAVDQRNTTLLRVARIVIEAQREFLDHGPEHLKPLPMIQVADQLGIHVGTVSRAVSEKYMQTPRGIFPLRMFFSGGTESASGEEMSWAAVQAKLKQIVEDEDPTHPLSDDQLVLELGKQGIDIARRTAAKYRQVLNIPPARRRRKF